MSMETLVMFAPLLPLACLILGSRPQQDTDECDVTMKMAVRRHLQRKRDAA